MQHARLVSVEHTSCQGLEGGLVWQLHKRACAGAKQASKCITEAQALFHGLGGVCW
jgi:hypothetical protein